MKFDLEVNGINLIIDPMIMDSGFNYFIVLLSVLFLWLYFYFPS